MRKLLILSSDTGEGHNSVAAAVKSTAETAGLTVSVRKPAEDSGRFNRTLGKVYNALLAHRPQWMNRYFWLIEHGRPNERAFLYSHAQRFIHEFLNAEKPDILLSVHPMLNHFLQRFIKEQRRQIPCYTFLTDPFPPFWHGWASPYVDRYFVPTAQSRDAIIGMGIPADGIEVIPMPVRRQFRPFTHVERQTFQRGLELDTAPTVLINGGARGGGPLTAVYRSVRKAAPETNILVVCGQNRSLRLRLSQSPDRRLRVFGFVPDIERYIGAADLVLTKPGGLATYETLACSVPLLLLGFGGLMPQESGTFQAAEEYRFAFAARSLSEVENIAGAGPSLWTALQDSQARFYNRSCGEELIERIHPNHVHA